MTYRELYDKANSYIARTVALDLMMMYGEQSEVYPLDADVIRTLEQVIISRLERGNPNVIIERLERKEEPWKKSLSEPETK